MPGLPGGRVTNDPSNYFAIGLQSEKDVDATTFYYLKHLDGTGFDVAVAASSERVGGVGREIGLRYRTKVTADGQFISYAQPDFLGRILAHALNQDTPTKAASNSAFTSWSHAINSGASTMPYVTVEQAWADETERTTNCLYSSIKLVGEAGKPVKATVQFVSGGTPHTQAAPLAPVREVAFPLMVPGGSAAITAGPYLAGQTGASSLQITKWSVELKQQLDDNIQTTSLQREDMLWLNTDYDIDGTFKYINNAAWNQVQYGGSAYVPTGLLTNGAFYFNTANPSGLGMTLFAPFVEMTGFKVNRLDPDGKTMYIDFVGATRNIGTQSLQCTVVSTASAAYTLSTT